jgi:hypothetical protein
MTLESLDKLVERTKQKREDDARRFKELDKDTCQLCHAQGEDKRSLIIACCYDVQEVVPEAIDLHLVDDPDLRLRGYYLHICKACRADFLTHLRLWAMNCRNKQGRPMGSDGNLCSIDEARNIPVRRNGAIVYLTVEEWEEQRRKKKNASQA